MLQRKVVLRCTSLIFRNFASGGPSQYLRLNAPAAQQFRHVRLLHSTYPRNGVMDGIRDAYSSAVGKTEKNREQAVFESQITFLTDGVNPINGDTFLSMLEKMKEACGMGGFREHLPWVQNNPGLQEFKDQEIIVKSMTPAERRDVRSISISGRKRIAKTCQQEIGKVEGLISQIESFENIRRWMIRRVDQDQRIPRNGEELRDMLACPSAGLRKIRRPKFPNPGVKQKRGARRR